MDQDFLWHNTQDYYLNIMMGGSIWYCTYMTYCALTFTLYITGQRGLGFRRLALRLEALNTQVQRLSRERDVTQLTREDLSLLLQRYSATSTVFTYKLYCISSHSAVTWRFLFQLQAGPARLSPPAREGAEESVSEARPAQPSPSPSVSHAATAGWTQTTHR